jgi:hypothetical protein
LWTIAAAVDYLPLTPLAHRRLGRKKSMFRRFVILSIFATAWASPAGSQKPEATGSISTAAARAIDDPDYETGRKAAQAELVKKLEVLADWCNSKELFQERDRVWHSILSLDTNNSAARKGLRYAHNPDGSWQEPAPREVKNRNPKALEELPAKRAAATEAFRNAMMALIAKEPEGSPLRKSAYDEILSIDPDDTVVRGLCGEKELDGKWVLQETWQGKKRRAEIKEFAKSAMASGAKVEKLEPSELEAGLGLHWTSMLKSESVRVLSTGEEDEARRAAELVGAVGPFFRSMFACDTPYRDDWTAYLLVHAGEKETFLEHFPDLSAEFRAFLKNVVGSGLPGQPRIVYWDKEPAHRVDGCARQTMNDFLGRTFGLSMNNGWVWEGFGLYLTREITGTRYTWFIQASSGGKYNSLRAKLMAPSSNWMNEGLTLLGAADHPKFAGLVENDVNRMGIEDMLYAYVFAAYMLEGHPEETPEFLREIGQTKQPTAKAIQNVIHLDTSQLEERLHRWLSERK